MRSPALAIAWVLWQRHRVLHLTALAAIPLCAIIYRAAARLLPNPSEQNFLLELPLTGLPLVLTLVLLLITFASTEPSARSGFSGLPPRWFTLPVSTTFLVIWPMALGALAIMAVYLAWAKIVFAPVGVELPLRWPLVVLPAVMVSFQAVVWSLPSFAWLRAGLIVAGAFGSCWLMALPAIPEFRWAQHELAWTGLVLGLIPLACLGTMWAVKGERGGGWRPWLSIRVFLRTLLDALPRRRAAFRSPDEALAWLSWRRSAWLQSCGLAFTATSAFFFLPVACMLDGDAGFPTMAVLSTMLWPVFFLWGAGATYAAFDGPNTRPLSPFHGVKPIADGRMAVIKLKVAARVVLFGWLLAISGILLLALWDRWRELWLVGNLLPRLAPIWPPSGPVTVAMTALALVAFLVLTWRLLVMGLSISLVGSERAFYTPLISRVVLGFGLLSAAGWLYQNPSALRHVGRWLEAGLAPVAAWKLWATIRSFAEARRRALFPPSTIARLVFVWVGVAVGVTILAVFFWKYAALPTPLVLLGAVILWPAGEIPRCALNLAANRHR